MKKGIHPKYEKVIITCSCGNTFESKSTKIGELRVEICSKCHPFYTGKQRAFTKRGRIEQFNEKYNIKKKTGGY